jgi:hypothetical protein
MRWILFVAALGLIRPSVAFATVMQPDGTVVPNVPNLQMLFDTRGERIDAVIDAQVTPESFVPRGPLRITLASRGGALFQNAFGWYNVIAGRAPDPSDLHELISCRGTVGDVVVADIAHDANYRGGAVGFYMRTPQERPDSVSCQRFDCCAETDVPGFNYFSQRVDNPDAISGGAVVHLLVYASTAHAPGYYFAWEDIYGGSDNDFVDFVALVENVVCEGAGAPCNTGLLGECAHGTTRCTDGTLTCAQTTFPTAEVCNGLDDDCNGVVDDPGVCPDAGEDVSTITDASDAVTPVDVVVPVDVTTDAGRVCDGGRCPQSPLIDGRAGPCVCRGAPGANARAPWWMSTCALLVVSVWARRRRRR